MVPGIDDAMFEGRYPVGTGWALGWYFARFADDHAVYVVSRPRGLPEDASIADMADGYVEVVAGEFGTADVLGISMGGMIGQELAARRPDLVDALVLANSGGRIADLATVRRFERYARERDWARIRAELAAAMFSDWRAVSYPPLALTAGRLVMPRPADSTDVTASLSAVEAFDATDHLGDVEAPTLVFGGTDDPFFPAPVLEETAANLPDAELATIAGGRHGAYHEFKCEFDARVDAFLGRHAEPGTTAVPAR